MSLSSRAESQRELRWNQLQTFKNLNIEAVCNLVRSHTTESSAEKVSTLQKNLLIAFLTELRTRCEPYGAGHVYAEIQEMLRQVREL